MRLHFFTAFLSLLTVGIVTTAANDYREDISNIDGEGGVDLLDVAEKNFEKNLCDRVRDALTTLGETATRAHPRLGLKTPLEPLHGSAPLKYVHEGDLLKLRLTMDNITLIGISSLRVEEVKFIFDPLKERFEHSQMSGLFDATSGDMTSSPNGKTSSSSKDSLKEVTVDDYYTEYDPILYQYGEQYYDSEENKVGDKKLNEKNTNPRKEYLYHSNVNRKDGLKDDEKKDSYYTDTLEYDYQFDDPMVHERIDEEDALSEKRGDQFSRKSGKLFNSNPLQSSVACGKHCKQSHKEESNKRNSNHKKSHHSKRQKSSRSTKNRKLSKDTHKLSARNRRSVSDDGEEKNDKPYRSIEGVIKVAFDSLEMTSSYLVRGSVGDVFTFKDHGTLSVFPSETVFLVSRLRVLLPSDIGRHSRRKSHGYVQRVETEESISPPKLELNRDTTPPRWVGSQVKLKLEELAAGIRRHRDGAVRHLIHQWEKLLRRIIRKVTPVPDMILTDDL